MHFVRFYVFICGSAIDSRFPWPSAVRERYISEGQARNSYGKFSQNPKKKAAAISFSTTKTKKLEDHDTPLSLGMVYTGIIRAIPKSSS